MTSGTYALFVCTCVHVSQCVWMLHVMHMHVACIAHVTLHVTHMHVACIAHVHALHVTHMPHRYMVNFYSLLNSENRYCMEQWEWLDKELTRARHRHEKVGNPMPSKAFPSAAGRKGYYRAHGRSPGTRPVVLLPNQFLMGRHFLGGNVFSLPRFC